MDFEPPLLETYNTLLQDSLSVGSDDIINDKYFSTVEKSERIPIVDLNKLNLDHFEREGCMREITEAARNWGFFQVVNHGVSQELMQKLQYEQKEVFRKPFASKSEENFLNLPTRSYRWGNPYATNLRQHMWSEALHMFSPDIAMMDQHKSLRSTIEAFVTVATPLAEKLVEILAQELNISFSYFQENCSANTSYLRLNRYPLCPFPSKVFGLLPHSDSSFLTIVHQDQIGGLQLIKDGIWIPVKPKPEALIVNIGDLFEALSNGKYTSVKHRVVAAEKVERFSTGYFYSPSMDTVIESYATPPVYNKFTFREYKEQTAKDVKESGDKEGLSRFFSYRNTDRCK